MVAPEEVEKISVTEFYQSTRIWKDLHLKKLTSVKEIKHVYDKGMPVVIGINKRPILKLAYFSEEDENSVTIISLDTAYKITDERLKNDNFVVYRIENIREVEVTDANTNKINLESIRIKLGDATEGALIQNSKLTQLTEMSDVFNDYEKGKFFIIEIDGERKVASYDENYSDEFIIAMVDFRAKIISHNSINGLSEYDNFIIYKIENYDDFVKNYKPLHLEKIKAHEDYIRKLEEVKKNPKKKQWTIDQVFEVK